MLRKELHYDLPPDRIAQAPAEPRDAARLLALAPDGALAHLHFRDILTLLRPDDVLVLNNTRVIPARLFCQRRSGGRVELFYLRDEDDGWRCLLRPSARLRVGETLAAGAQQFAVLARHERGEWTLRPEPPQRAAEYLGAHGLPPLPPYIRRAEPTQAALAGDRERYQTVYAQRPGAVAAPTAGLHFTPALLDEIGRRGIARIEVTLHVGLGTFAPLEAEDLRDHRMHREWYEIAAAALAALQQARRAGRRIVGVGTTTARVLESAADAINGGAAGPLAGWTDIFLYPPCRFRVLDALLTNFHLPESTLLALVMAFGGVERVRQAYATAVAEGYRFFSYGDAMFLHRA